MFSSIVHYGKNLNVLRYEESSLRSEITFTKGDRSLDLYIIMLILHYKYVLHVLSRSEVLNLFLVFPHE